MGLQDIKLNVCSKLAKEWLSDMVYRQIWFILLVSNNLREFTPVDGLRIENWIE
ncbi:MAG: hypothetical protein Q9M92_15030 [Enterobacterales bacterium]|nr:hypothetical protein [Enterobacterales bacterium]